MRRLAPVDFDDEKEGGMDLTPLLDVVFVVLIMFIVVVPILELDKVWLAPGRSSAKETKTVQGNSPVTIHVRGDNSIWVHGKQIAMETLPEWLEGAFQQNPTTTPQLFHDRRAQFGTYQLIKNAVEGAGYRELDVILDPK